MIVNFEIKKENEDILIEFEENRMTLTFDVLKEISMKVLNCKKSNEQFEYNIECDSSLDLYKNAIKSVIESIKQDEDLYDLFVQNDVVEESTLD